MHPSRRAGSSLIIDLPQATSSHEKAATSGGDSSLWSQTRRRGMATRWPPSSRSRSTCPGTSTVPPSQSKIARPTITCYVYKHSAQLGEQLLDLLVEVRRRAVEGAHEPALAVDDEQRR